MSFLFQISEGFPGDFLLLVPDLIPLRLGHVLRVLRRELWRSTQSVPRWPQARSGAVCLCPAGWGVCAEVAQARSGGVCLCPAGWGVCAEVAQARSGAVCLCPARWGVCACRV